MLGELVRVECGYCGTFIVPSEGLDGHICEHLVVGIRVLPERIKTDNVAEAYNQDGC